MNVKTYIPLVMAVVLGLIAAMLARASLSRSRGVAQDAPKTVKVVVARGPIAPGQELTADVLTLGAIAAEVPPPNSFTDPRAAVGRVTATALFNGQPVMEDLLAVRGAGSGIQALVPRGMRAATLEVNEMSGLAGMLVPGCRVDVVSTLNGANKDDTLACTIVQDVLVQAVGQRLTGPPAGADKDAQQPARSVTLIVTPRDAEAIELASSMGRTRLVLRGADDRALSETDGVTFVELRKDDMERVKVPVVAVTTPPVTVASTQPAGTKEVDNDPFGEDVRPRRTVTLIRGGAKTEVVFDLSGKPGPDAAVTRTPTEPVER